MNYRRADSEEMIALWQKQFGEKDLFTREFFARKINAGETVFFAAEQDGELIGELYACTELEDHAFAQKNSRAYLCAFRIRKDLRGQGIGTGLMRYVLTELAKCGYSEITIGVDSTDAGLMQYYRSCGFIQEIGIYTEDPCSRDEDMRPAVCEPFTLLLRKIQYSSAQAHMLVYNAFDKR